MTTSEIKELFHQLKLNITTSEKINKGLYSQHRKTEWAKALSDRAVEQKRLFAENNELLDKLYAFLQTPELTPEEADALKDAVTDYYQDNCDEYEIMLPVLEKILPYYREKQDYDTIAALCYIAFYETMEVKYRFCYPLDQESFLSYCEEIISLEPHYSEMTSKVSRKRFLMNYDNLVAVMTDNRHLSPRESFDYLLKLRSFWAREDVQALDGSDPDFVDLYFRSNREWLGASFDYFDSMNPEEQSIYRDILQTELDRHFAEGGLEENVPDELIPAILMLKVRDGEIAPEEAPILYSIQLKTHIAYNEEHQTAAEVAGSRHLSYDNYDFFYSYLFCIQVTSDLINTFHLKLTDYQDFYEDFLLKIRDNWEQFYKVFPPAYIDDVIANYGFHILSGIGNLQLQQEIFDMFVIRRDIATYLHCNMVAQITTTIARHILAEKPELFEGMLGYHGEEIPLHADDYLSFLAEAAKYHDVGKFGISAIVNIQTRKIQDGEFRMITRHPMAGYQLAKQLPFLAPYKDIIAGHHKSYDGTFGYPKEFDNTVSPLRTFIDLITLADCMDAATDFLGRNYHTAKSVDNLVDEFIAQKGTRYNPELADFIANCLPLRQELAELVRSGRVDLCYQVYDETSEINGK